MSLEGTIFKTRLTTATCDGENAKEIQRGEYRDGMSAWHNRARNTDLIGDTVDCVRWRNVTD